MSRQGMQPQAAHVLAQLSPVGLGQPIGNKPTLAASRLDASQHLLDTLGAHFIEMLDAETRLSTQWHLKGSPQDTLFVGSLLTASCTHSHAAQQLFDALYAQMREQLGPANHTDEMTYAEWVSETTTQRLRLHPPLPTVTLELSGGGAASGLPE